MRSRALVVLLAFAAAAGCATPCKRADTRSERREFAEDDERCDDQARKQAGNVWVGDYVSCMRARGWCEAPESALGTGAVGSS